MIRCSMTRLLCVRLGAGPSSATLVNLHIVRRVALSQANIWSKPMGKGTGLGLSMIYGFVRQSDGAVTIDSEFGKGTSVEICLPRYKGDVVDAPVEGPSGDHRAGANEVVLIVEDQAV